MGSLKTGLASKFSGKIHMYNSNGNNDVRTGNSLQSGNIIMQTGLSQGYSGKVEILSSSDASSSGRIILASGTGNGNVGNIDLSVGASKGVGALGGLRIAASNILEGNGGSIHIAGSHSTVTSGTSPFNTGNMNIKTATSGNSGAILLGVNPNHD